MIERWLQPVAGDANPCGPLLEYDNAYLALATAAAGRPETQFQAAEPPNWRQVHEASAELLDRSRDLQLAMYWVRSGVHLHGLGFLPAGVALLQGLLDTFWDTLHPALDESDGDAFARGNVLALLGDPEAFVADVRQAVLFNQKAVGELRIRAVEIAIGQVTARKGETALKREQVTGMLAAAVLADPPLREVPAQGMAALTALSTVIGARMGAQRLPDLKPVQGMLRRVEELMPERVVVPEPVVQADEATGDAAGAGAPKAAVAPEQGLSGSIRTRADAMKAIDMLCEYLERTEPTNPAQLLLRRAHRLINRNFLQLMKELAPGALADVARVMGIDPETVKLDDLK